jgi:hypothetical protein
MEWCEIRRVQTERDLEVAVIDTTGTHPVAFPCRYREGIWINATTRKQIEINPTHWREWKAC